MDYEEQGHVASMNLCQSGPDEDVTDNFDDMEFESTKGYRIGGLCPVEIDDVLDRTYRIIQKLSYAPGSTSWLAQDLRFQPTQRSPHNPRLQFVCLKILAANSTPSTAELQIRTTLQNETLLKTVQIFSHQSPNGLHTVFVTPLYQPVGTIPQGPQRVEYIHSLAYQLFQAVAFLHKAQVIHGRLPISCLGYLCSPMTPEMLSKFPRRRILPIPWIQERGSSRPSYLVSCKAWKQSIKLFELPAASALRIVNFGYAFNSNPGPGSLLPLVEILPSCLLAPEYVFPIQAKASATERRYGDPGNLLLRSLEKVDIWILGCTVYELITGLEIPEDEGIYEQIQHLLQIDTRVPKDWYTSKAVPNAYMLQWPSNGFWDTAKACMYDTKNQEHKVNRAQARALLMLLRQSLQLDPRARPSAEEGVRLLLSGRRSEQGRLA